MRDELVVLDGSTFFVSDLAGDVGGGELGFFFADTRHLSRWELLVDGAPIHLLTTGNVDYYSARIFGAIGGVRVGVNPAVSVQRDRIVANGVHEDVFVENHSPEARQVVVELRYGADFADLFEVKEDAATRRAPRVEVAGDSVTFWYEHGGFRRGTRLAFSVEGDIGSEAARFAVRLEPRTRWNVCVDVSCFLDEVEHGPRAGHGGFGHLQPQMPLTLEEWLAEAPELETDADAMVHTYRQSLIDLAALRFRPFPGMEASLPAAGLPWFMTVFGRDSLLAAYMALPFFPRLAAATLEALAAFQATGDDPFRDAEPGKVLHEWRRGELTVTGKTPHSPYYGSHDATPLFLVLLDEYQRWTGDEELVGRLEPAAGAALAWIEGPGDPDGDGYLEYRTRSPKGLVNQGWKDSGNSILFADGRTAEPPIATCEIQGYAFAARRGVARLARTVWGDAELAERLEADAATLAARFEADFWCEERDHPALALDGAKARVDALTSNIGHLLWTGILNEQRAARVAALLNSEALASGWGVRTMASTEAGYIPIEYHNGTVWPHDTAIVAEGLRRYGYREQASGLGLALFQAAEAFDHRLPEVFAGFPRADTTIPVEYPTASRPQAWAAAAPLLALRTFLGLDVVDREVRASPWLPAGVGRLVLRRVPAHGTRVDVA